MFFYFFRHFLAKHGNLQKFTYLSLNFCHQFYRSRGGARPKTFQTTNINLSNFVFVTICPLFQCHFLKNSKFRSTVNVKRSNLTNGYKIVIFQLVNFDYFFNQKRQFK